MKILILTPIFPPEIGGPATYSDELLSRLPSEDVSVKVVSFASVLVPTPQGVELVDTSGGMIVRQIKFLLASIRNTRQVDIVFILEPAVVGLVGLLCAKLLRKKLILKYVGDPTWERAKDNLATNLSLDDFLSLSMSRNQLSYKITKFVLQNCDRVIVPSNYLKKVLTKQYGLRSDQVAIIYNSIEIPKRKLPKKKEQIVCVGRLVTWKNVDLIIDAFIKIPKSNQKLELKIIGSGPLENELKKRSQKIKLNNRQITFTGALSRRQAQQEIERSLALVLFSDYEGLPHVALEAMATKTVVIASKIPGTDEVVVDGKTGVLVEPKNVVVLARKISQIVENNTMREKLSYYAFEFVQKDFSWKKNLSKLLEIFNEVTKK